MSPVHVLIVDDEELIRQGLRIFVDSDERTTVVGIAVDGADALAQTAELRPDVILMDIQMPGVDGIEATRRITDEWPDVKVLALTTFSSQHHVVSALRAGASGYLVKDTAPEVLVQAIVDVDEGKSALSPQISRELVTAVRAPEIITGQIEVVSDLTGRELEIVQLLAQGKSNAEIGAELHIAETTVKANFGRIMAKWNARDRVQVLVRAAKSGLVALE